jgi:predicted signal transduction protein with EAL and GGDEF domain
VLAASVAYVVAWRTNENQLLRDPLNGLPSRVLYPNNLKLALERLGHGEDDELLVAVAERVGHSLRRHETLARFRGDEFVILREDTTRAPSPWPSGC